MQIKFKAELLAATKGNYLGNDYQTLTIRTEEGIVGDTKADASFDFSKLIDKTVDFTLGLSKGQGKIVFKVLSGEAVKQS